MFLIKLIKLSTATFYYNIRGTESDQCKRKLRCSTVSLMVCRIVHVR